MCFSYKTFGIYIIGLYICSVLRLCQLAPVASCSVALQDTSKDETVWLTIDQMSQLFGRAPSTINEHILKVYAEGELRESDSLRKIGISDFSTKPTNFYNLDMIISAVSIPSNIAEGSAKPSDNEFAKYLDIALGSSYEVETQLLIANKVGYLQEEKYQELISKLHGLERQITALIKFLRSVQ